MGHEQSNQVSLFVGLFVCLFVFLPRLWQARQLAKIAGNTELYVKLTCDLAEFNRKCRALKRRGGVLFVCLAGKY